MGWYRLVGPAIEGLKWEDHLRPTGQNNLGNTLMGKKKKKEKPLNEGGGSIGRDHRRLSVTLAFLSSHSGQHSDTRPTARACSE